MRTVPETPDTFLLSYDPACQLLRGYWAGPVTEAALRTHYAELLAAAQAHGNCPFWLLDMRGRNWHTPTFGEWFGTTYAATIRAALGHPVFVAYVLGPGYQAIANSLGVAATQRGCAAHGFYPFFFDNVPDALAWLEHQQAHDKGQ